MADNKFSEPYGKLRSDDQIAVRYWREMENFNYVVHFSL